MQQQVTRWLLATLILLVASSSVRAQAAPTTATPANDADAPMVVLVSQRPDDAPARRDDINLALTTALRKMLVDSHKFRVFVYDFHHASVKRAILDHAVSASDLIKPIKLEALQQLAHALGAHYVLSYLAVTTKNEVSTDGMLQENVGKGEWRTLFGEQFRTATVVGKRHLKPDETAALLTDTIATRMSLPYTLPVEIRALKDKNVNRQDAKNAKETQSKAGGEENTASSSPVGAPLAAPNEKAAPKGAGGAEQGTKSDNPKAKVQNSPPDLRTDASPDILNHPPPTEKPQTPATTEDDETQAARFREQGDLANVIRSLRHAINERPRDTGLRRQLIQAYQDRHLLDEALAESNRALLLAPNDAGLHRLHGDALRAKAEAGGDVKTYQAAAIKEYQEATRLNPADVAAQVALGDAQLADNQYADALHTYQTAAQTDPKSPLPHRRLARALLESAGSDSARYPASIAQVEQARALLPPTDTQTYLHDYADLTRVLESRLLELLDTLQNTYQAARSGQRSGEELTRAVADLRARAEAASDYLDKLPPASGEAVTHAHYQQAAAFLLQAQSLFRDYLAKGDSATADSLTDAVISARREIAAAVKRLASVRAESGSSAANPSLDGQQR